MNYQDAVRNLSSNRTKDNLSQQVENLLKNMTLKEKVKLTYGINPFIFFSRMIYGVMRGSFLMMPFLSGGCKRLGIPKIVFSDGPRGAVIRRNTCFPVASMRAAAFDDELEEKVGKIIAKEVIAGGGNYFGGICLNIVRNPRWGRAQESYGEDPYLIGRMGEIMTRVIQAEGLIACPKHFALNSIENLRFQVSANTDERTLREIYLPHFKKSIDAGAMSVMSAYNRVNGKYCAENKYLLTDILRDEWGFDGFVMSDFMYGVHDCKESYEAGVDIEMPLKGFRKKAINMIKNGTLDPKYVDQSAGRVLRALLWQTPQIKPQPKSIAKCKEHIEVAREAAVKGTVLLKNNGVLPVGANEKIAVVGPYADTVNTGDHGSSSIWCKDGVTAYQGLKTVYKEAAVYNGLNVDAALQAAQAATIVVVCVGSNRLREGELLNNDIDKLEKNPDNRTGGDRTLLRLTADEIKLIKTLKQSGKKVIVSMLTGSVFLTNDFEKYADGIFLSFYGGVQAGNALADLISGKVSPSGKLPFTIAKSENDYPPFIEVGEKPYEIDYGYYLGYMLFDKKEIEPEYPFGYGLSYTTFSMTDAVVHKTETDMTVKVSVKNNGKMQGAEVVQVYIGSGGAEEDRPVKQLKGYKRVVLKPGESRKVEIKVNYEELRFYHTDSKSWQLDKEYIVYVGNDSRNVIRLADTVQI